jgi:hypothetical protein
MDKSFSPGDQHGKVKRKSVGIVKLKGFCAIYKAACVFLHEFVHPAQPGIQCAQKGLFFFQHHPCHKILLRLQFGENIGKLFGQHRYKPVQQGLFYIQITKIKPYRPAQYASDDITCAGVGRQLPVGNGKTDGADMVGNYTECDIGFTVAAVVLLSAKLLGFGDGTRKNIGIVVAVFALAIPAQAFRAPCRYLHVWRAKIPKYHPSFC